jgi:hypothetical protein
MRVPFFLLLFLAFLFSFAEAKEPRKLPSSFSDPTNFFYMENLKFHAISNEVGLRGNYFFFGSSDFPMGKVLAFHNRTELLFDNLKNYGILLPLLL